MGYIYINHDNQSSPIKCQNINTKYHIFDTIYHISAKNTL